MILDEPSSGLDPEAEAEIHTPDPAHHGPTAIPNPWTVTSPLLPSTTGVEA